MCLLVNTYQTCALFGHPIEAANATGFDMALCDEATASGAFGDCKNGARPRNIPDFACPFCVECNGLEVEAYAKIQAILKRNEQGGERGASESDNEVGSSSKTPTTSVMTEGFVEDLRGLPIDRARAPAIPCDLMIAALRAAARAPLSEVDRVRASAWAAAEKRRVRRPPSSTASTGPTSSMGGNASDANDDDDDEDDAVCGRRRELFARWLVHACRAAHVEAAVAIARREGDEARVRPLQLLAAQAAVASTYRARLECVGAFGRLLSRAGLDG